MQPTLENVTEVKEISCSGCLSVEINKQVNEHLKSGWVLLGTRVEDRVIFNTDQHTQQTVYCLGWSW
mgnify:CR=1 FL=1